MVSIDFRAKIRTTRPQHELDNVVEDARQALEGQLEQIIQVEVRRFEAGDVGSVVGGTLEVTVDGTIHYHPVSGGQNWEMLEGAGNASFGHTFRLLSMFILDTTDKTATSAGVHCRRCCTRVGEVPSVVRLVASGRQDEIHHIAEAVARAHVEADHPDVDPEQSFFSET